MKIPNTVPKAVIENSLNTYTLTVCRLTNTKPSDWNATFSACDTTVRVKSLGKVDLTVSFCLDFIPGKKVGVPLDTLIIYTPSGSSGHLRYYTRERTIHKPILNLIRELFK